MIPRMIELYKNKAFSGDSGTDTLSLKRNDQVLEYILKVRAKNGSSGNSPDAAVIPTPEQALTKIEIKSGGTVFKSYTGEQCRKLATYRNGRLPQTLFTQAVGGTWAGNEDPNLGWSEFTFPINFNLADDPMGNRSNVMLPAPLYDSLDLVMDYNFTISSTAGFATDEMYFDLYALTLPKQDEVTMLNKKILVEQNKHDYTSLASGDASFAMTTDADRFLRQLMVTAYTNAIGEGVNITEGKVKVNGDPTYTWKWGDQQAKNALDCKLYFNYVMYLLSVGTSDELWTRIPAPLPMLSNGDVTSAVSPYFTALGNGDKVTVTTEGADINLLSIGSNVVPATVFVDYDQDNSLQNLQYQGVKDLELILTNGGAGATVKVLEQSIAKVWGR